MKAASADGKLPAAATGLEARYDIKGDGVVTVRRRAELLGTVTIAAIADSAPSIQPLGEPQADSRGTLALTYEVKDDYGVVSAEARLGKPVRNGKPIETRRPPLIPRRRCRWFCPAVTIATAKDARRPISRCIPGPVLASR